MGDRRIALGVLADGEVDLVRGMVDLLRDQLDRVIVAEARRTFQGEPREVIGAEWAHHLDLTPDRFRSVVTDLPARAAADTQEHRQREGIQRTALALGVRDYGPDDLLLVLDSDEFVDPAWLAMAADAIEVPTRLRFVPLYGGLDRRAPDWHCCRKHLGQPPGVWRDDEPSWLFPGGVAIPVGDLDQASTQQWRHRPLAMSAQVAGWHLQHVLPPDSDPSRKLGRQAHVWHPDLDRSHVSKAIEMGIHPYGWWAASAIDVPAALRSFADRHPEAVQGPLPPDDLRRDALATAFGRFAEEDALTVSWSTGHDDM